MQSILIFLGRFCKRLLDSCLRRSDEYFIFNILKRLKEIATGLTPLAMTIVFYIITTPLMATALSEELSYIDIAHNAEYLEIFRPFDGKKYRMRIGIGCMPALFDDLSKDTKIYAVKLGDLLNPYGDGDMGLVYIETPHHKVRCKIVDMQPF